MSRIRISCRTLNIRVLSLYVEGYYFPRTFFVEKVLNKEDDIYIANQEEIKVKIDKRIIML